MKNSRLIHAAAAAVLIVGAVPVADAQQAADTSLKITFGGFVDGYYAYDFGRPPTLDRSFTTQPARHNEFNVNLAHVEAVLTAERVRGRFAVQYGTSVQSNYAAEPTRGAISGPSVARHIQEAVIGTRLGEGVWVDGGIFFSHMGMESWLSRDNPTYTRWLVADYSPYYSAGAKLTWQATPRLSVRLDVVNGWQNISETNTDKAAGMRLDYSVAGGTLSYYNFFGNEVNGLLRIFNGVGAKVSAGRAQLLAEFDYGTQERPASGSSTWYGLTLIARAPLTSTVSLSGRFERFDDRDGVVLNTAVTSAGAYVPFRANGASVGIDVVPHARLMWRSELRGFQGDKSIFPNGGATSLRDSNTLVVTSLSLTL